MRSWRRRSRGSRSIESGMGSLASRGQTATTSSMPGSCISRRWAAHLRRQVGAIFQNEAGVKAAELLKRLSTPPAGRSQLRLRRDEERLPPGQGGDVPRFDRRRRRGGRSREITRRRQCRLGPASMGTRRGSQTGGFGIAIPNNASNPEAAFMLMQWLTPRRRTGDRRGGRLAVALLDLPRRRPQQALPLLRHLRRGAEARRS